MKIFRRVLCMLLAFMVMLSVPVTALAAEFDLYLGDVNVTADESGQTTSQPDTNTSYVGYDVTITTSAPTDNTVTITTSGGDASVTLQDVTIDATGTGEAAVTVDRGEGTTVTIELDGTNTLQSDKHHAGLETRGEGELVIQDQTGEAGSLEANGGDHGAGIGAGNQHGDGSHITINSGTIEANGGDKGGAGIGGGDNGAVDVTDITINGGSVTANGGHYSAGIGGGLGGDGTGITINGGTVTAIGGEHSYTDSGKDAAGIGGGRSGVGSDITITGGNVTAVSSGHGAGIGGGHFNHGENITITGGTIHAESKGDGAGIGGGVHGNGSDITITGGNVTAVSSGDGAGIGGGLGSAYHGENITITGGTIHAESKRYGAGIGGGWGGDGSDILIQKDPVITAKSGYGDYTIGGGFRGETINYDHSGLYTTGSINGVPGTVEPPVEEMPPVETPLSSGPEEEPVMTAKNIAYDRFWRQVEEKIRETPRGESLTIDAGGYASMPSYVMDAVADTGVTLVIQWFGGDDVVVDHAYSGSVTYYRFYFSVLPALLAD